MLAAEFYWKNAEDEPVRKIHLHNKLILFCLLFVTGCNQPRQETPKTPASDQPADSPVRYVKAVQQTVPERLDLAAKVQPDPTKSSASSHPQAVALPQWRSSQVTT